MIQDTEILIPVRDAWLPEILSGYLPVPSITTEKLNDESDKPIVITYAIDQAPPGTQLSFILSKWKDGLALCSFAYPEELLNRINVFHSLDDVNNTSETRH